MAYKRTFTHFDTKQRVTCWCSGKSKILYATRDMALQARNRRHALLRAYECAHGNGWHLTSQLTQRTK